jgi:hypothetical protein
MTEATSPRDELIVDSHWFDEIEHLVPASSDR